MKEKNSQRKPATNIKRLVAFGTALLASTNLLPVFAGEVLVETPDQLQETRQIQQSEVNKQLANIRDGVIKQSINLNSATLSQDVILKMNKIELANEQNYQQQEQVKEVSRWYIQYPGMILYNTESFANNNSQGH